LAFRLDLGAHIGDDKFLLNSKDMVAPVYRPFSYSPTIWGPKYWFFLHTVARTYPEYPNDVTKRKYYDLIQNFALFMPDREMGDRFLVMLDKYPVTPYLDNRESFFRWTVFIHNKINAKLQKEERSVEEALESYESAYLEEGEEEVKKTSVVLALNAAIVLALIAIAYMVYQR